MAVSFGALAAKARELDAKTLRSAHWPRHVSGAFNWALELRRELLLTFRPDELYRVPTDDGSSIALGRYHPRGERRFAEPVILCHGLGANRFNLDFDEKLSVARYLARRGFETWVVELRGRGLAGRDSAASFDDQARYDVGAAIRTVMSTGAPGVTWVGHSKGGMLLFAHLGLNKDAPVRAAVALGSPATFGIQPGLKRFIKTIAPVLKMKVIPTGRLVSLARLGPPPGPMTTYLINLANTDPLVVRQSLYNCACDIGGGVGRQFAGWIASGRFDSVDGATDYRKLMGEVRVPFLLIAGAKDLLAPPESVRVSQKALGGPVEFVLASKADGFANDYGHGDLTLGRNAPEDIFPRIAEFLAARSTPA